MAGENWGLNSLTVGLLKPIVTYIIRPQTTNYPIQHIVSRQIAKKKRYIKIIIICGTEMDPQ